MKTQLTMRTTRSYVRWGHASRRAGRVSGRPVTAAWRTAPAMASLGAGMPNGLRRPSSGGTRTMRHDGEIGEDRDQDQGQDRLDRHGSSPQARGCNDPAAVMVAGQPASRRDVRGSSALPDRTRPCPGQWLARAPLVGLLDHPQVDERLGVADAVDGPQTLRQEAGAGPRCPRRRSRSGCRRRPAVIDDVVDLGELGQAARRRP